MNILLSNIITRSKTPRTRSSVLSMVILLLFTCSSKAQHYYFGSMHSHSEYSDGNQAGDPAYMTAKACLEYADQRALQIDFWGISDHNHGTAGMQLADYQRGVLEADSVNADGSFAAFYGMEWGVISSGGHVLVYGIDSLVGWENGNYLIFNAQQDYGSLFNLVASRGENAFACLAHMDPGDFSNILGTAYNPVWDHAISAMAVRSGPAFSTDTTYSDPSSSDYFDRFQEMLAKGYHLGPVIDHDNHYINFGRSQQARTVVIADTLTREALLESFRKMRFYASDDWNTELDFSANGRPMGTIFSSDSVLELAVSVSDPDNEHASRIRIWYGISGSGLVASVLTQNTQQDSLRYSFPAQEGISYYFIAEVTQQDGHRILSSPVWYTRNGNPPPFQLISLNASLINRKARLDWSTVNESGIARFEIEKSVDTTNFIFRDSVKAKGGPGVSAIYNWNDSEILNKATYYRLNIFDTLGNNIENYQRKLDPVFLELNVSLQPGLAGTGIIWIQVEHNRNEPLRMEVYSSSGQLVYSSSVYAGPGVIFLPFDTYSLSSGLYFIRFSNADNSLESTLKFMKG